MQFQKGHLYHIYNQGNNRQDIFFERDNYLFFLKKVRTHFLPYCDILAYCLMPNHFHFMVRVKTYDDAIGSATQSRAPNPIFNQALNNRQAENDFNKSIGIMLASYTRAINKRFERTGSLFRQKTKANCVSCSNGLSPSFIQTELGALLKVCDSLQQYPQVCFNYIHQNPVKARLVKNREDWEFSSARDYLGLRKGNLVNIKLCAEYIDLSDYQKII